MYNAIEYEFSEPTLIAFVGDMHFGVENSYFEIAMKYLENFEGKIVLMGDILDNAILGSVGNIYEQVKNPNEQFLTFQESLKKLREKILAVVGGNHEYRTKKSAGVDVLELICTGLEIPYISTFGVLDLSVRGAKRYGALGRYSYSIAVHHGAAGGRYGEKSIRQSRWFAEFLHGVDAYVTAHTHFPQISTDSVFLYDNKNKKILKKEVYYVTVGSFADDEYAERKLLKPSTFCYATVLLHQTEKKMSWQLVNVR